ncbi:SpoIIE family protein phosphatase [Xylophilus rhododendri]|uniref:SpoIIE family protein phosphatase n=1 Tax=Xylophilus rhododendri TaxID=2697032 RepID=A0A857JDD7_9BURK|nr:protein phosphatase 2C domain-containing protein [Xylophilus rhododendri]QHJ00973.1 SpoIIE family protein phosphatase [Xylophilus rhododendri]
MTQAFPAEDLAPPHGAPAIELAILSRPGGRNYNEDACGHWHSDRHLCCVVADGAGGHGGGDVAARIAVRHVIEQFAAAPVMDSAEVEHLLLDTNATVIRHRADAPAQAQMHSTVVSLFIDLERAEALWGHAGDSRLYLFREGRVFQRTSDHSVVQSMVDAGVLQPEQARTHARRSELLSALGSAPEHLHLSAAPAPCPLLPGDVFLMCTDGLWEYVDDAELCRTLQAAEHPQAWLAELEQSVLRNAAAMNKPGHDNFSGISVWIG